MTTRRFASLWRYTVAGADVAWGAVFLFGGAAKLPYQQLLKEVMPMQVWGGLLVLVGTLLFTRHLRAGGVGGALVWAASSLATVITVSKGISPSAASPVLLVAFAIFHLLITYGAASGLAATTRR